MVSVGVVTLISATGYAQMVVSDPTNFAQNLIQAKAAVDQLEQAGKMLDQDRALNRKAGAIKKNTKKIIEGMTPGELAELRDYLDQVGRFYDQSRGLSYTYGDIVEEYDRVYTDFEPAAYGSEDYEKLQKQWEGQTDHALRQAFEAHGYGGEESVKERMRRLEKLIDKSDSTEGVLAAIQLGNRLQAELVAQVAQLTQLLTADSRARLSHLAETKAEQKNSRTRQRDLMKGLGEAKDRELREYPGFKQ
jgi:P-type conjugative transfer protein TrbJ